MGISSLNDSGNAFSRGVEQSLLRASMEEIHAYDTVITDIKCFKMCNRLSPEEEVVMNYLENRRDYWRRCLMERK